MEIVKIIDLFKPLRVKWFKVSLKFYCLLFTFQSLDVKLTVCFNFNVSTNIRYNSTNYINMISYLWQSNTNFPPRNVFARTRWPEHVWLVVTWIFEDLTLCQTGINRNGGPNQSAKGYIKNISISTHGFPEGL